ncbi:TPA: hypothetical protein RKY22_005225 [Klebsiella michiganensis]|nr:hypothetical protein [Klebsiella michiganensis]
MNVTYKEIKNDIRVITDALDNEERFPPSTARCFLLCATVPTLCVLINALFFVEICAFSNGKSVLSFSNLTYLYKGFSAIPVYAALVIAFVQVLMFAPQVCLYLSIPYHVRKNSLIIRGLKKITTSALFMMVGLVFAANFIAIQSPMMLFATPVIMVLSILSFNYVIGFQIAKYGLSPVIARLSKALREE